AAQAVSDLDAVDERERHRLNDADRTRLGGGRHQLDVAAGVHGAADQRHLDAGVPCERRLQRHRTSPSRHWTRTLATMSPPASRISACTSWFRSPVTSGTLARQSQSSVPRAFFRYTVS